MEDDNQILDNKTKYSKSECLINYIYKRVIVKEKNKNSKNDLDSLICEKIAKNKMKKMSLNSILDLLFKIKNSLNQNNQFLKYIKDVQLYNYCLPNKIEFQKGRILKEYPKYKINNGKSEKILNFTINNKNMKNPYFNRMCNIDCKKIILNRKEKIILIQSHIRSFLRKKIIDEEVNKIIAKRIINKILIIQRNIEKFLNRKKSLDKLIIKIIKKERISKYNKIIDIFSLYQKRNLYKKHLIIKKILKVRNNSVILIQRQFRCLILRKKVKELLEKEKKYYILTYPFSAKSVQIKISMNNSYKLYNYTICPIRKIFVLYLNKESIAPGEYLCQMIVNNNIILDKRYKYMIDKYNNFFNLIYIGRIPQVQQPKIPIKVNLRKDQKEKKYPNNRYNNINENTDEFFHCCSTSTNYSINKSEYEKNKLVPKTEKIDKKHEFIFDKVNKEKIKGIIKSYKVKEKTPIYPPSSRFCNFMNINTGNVNIKNISMKKYKTSRKEGTIINQKLKYNYILDELSESTSSKKSNISMTNINSYSIKTHKTKFNSKLNKKEKSNRLDISNTSNSKTINTTVSNKDKHY